MAYTSAYSHDNTKEINELPETPQKLNMFYYLTFCNRAIGFLLNILVIFYTFQYRGGVYFYPFNWHPLLMIFGMVFLYSRGILFYRTERTIAMARLKLMYARITIVSGILIIAGLVAGLEKNDLESAELLETSQKISTNFYNSTHSCVGSISVILFFFECIVELFSYLYPRVNNEISQSSNTRYTRDCWSHLTVATFLGAVASCVLGFHETTEFYANKGGEDYGSTQCAIIWLIYLSLTAFAGLTVYLYLSDSFKRAERPDDEHLLSNTAVFKHLCCIPWSFQECTYSLRMIFSRNQPSLGLTNVDARC